LKLCVFPNDPLKASFEKGEIKERYFNPDNLFNEIHVISFVEKDIEEEKVKELVGNASLKIHCVGKINLKNMKDEKKRVINLVKNINPDVIRAYNPLVQGWIAAHCSKKLVIPFVLSLHGEYDRFRAMIKKQNFKQYLKLVYTSKFVEPFVIKNASRVICVYKVIIPYAKKKGAKKIDLVYNRVDLSRFIKKSKNNEKEIPLIISVGRLIKQKKHEIIIRAISNLKAKLLIIGDGVDYEHLLKLTKKLNIEDKVSFQRSVPHSEIHSWYHKADVFALAMRTDLESLPIPILEAMASGLPVVIPKPSSSELYDDLGEGVILVDNKPEAFRKALEEIIDNKDLKADLSEKVLEKIKSFDGKIMEQKERKIYEELLKK